MMQGPNQTRFQMNRRSFIRNATAIGLGITGAAVINPLTSTLAMAADRENFVGTKGKNFTLNDDKFYFAGTNNYYLHYNSHFMIDDVLQNAVAMGLPVIRCWGFLDGQSSNGFVMQPTPGVYPEEGYERFDYTVWRARQLGLKLVVALTNNWDAFGGMDQYVKWFNGNGHDSFYTNESIKQAYKSYIKNFLNRYNRYTGKKMKNEAAIMTWELANEPRCESDTSGDTLLNWAREMSDYIKDKDKQHLVSVGDEGFYNYPGNADWARAGISGVDWKRLIALPNIDYGTMHLYPNDWGKTADWSTQWITDHIHDGHAAGKPVVLEEYGWRDLTTRDAIYQSWTDTVYNAGGNGDQFWILTGLQDDGTLYPNYDGYRVTNPSSTASVLAAHAAKMHAESK